MKTLTELRKTIDDGLAIRADTLKNLGAKRIKCTSCEKTLTNASSAHLILQHVAKQTQEQLEYKISELVSLALSSVFPNPYELKLTYEMKRNKTEANLWFYRDGHYTHPLDGGGHGPADVAGFALRAALWSIRDDKLNNVIWEDEPFKNINDDTRELHKKAALMVSEVSKKLGIQFIIVSQLPELREVADSIFEVKIKNEVSNVVQIR